MTYVPGLLESDDLSPSRQLIERRREVIVEVLPSRCALVGSEQPALEQTFELGQGPRIVLHHPKHYQLRLLESRGYPHGAKTALYVAARLRNSEIGAPPDLLRQIVSKGHKRSFRQPLAALEEQPRGGRPSRFSPRLVVAVKLPACQLPCDTGLPLPRHSIPELKPKVLRGRFVASIGETTPGCWLDRDAIRPWCRRSWVFLRDPELETKGGRIPDRYQAVCEGRPLSAADLVIRAQEQTNTQAPRRFRASHSLEPGDPGSKHEYTPPSPWAYLAAWDARKHTVFDRREGAHRTPPRAEGRSRRS